MAFPAISRHTPHHFSCAVLAGLLVLGAASNEAATPVRNILVLQSLDRGNLTLDHFTGNFRVDLDRLAATVAKQAGW